MPSDTSSRRGGPGTVMSSLRELMSGAPHRSVSCLRRPDATGVGTAAERLLDLHRRSGRAVDDMTEHRPTALVTGASRGLGRALAADLAQDGWRAVVDARHGDELAAAVAGLAGVVDVPGDVA